MSEKNIANLLMQSTSDNTRKFTKNLRQLSLGEGLIRVCIKKGKSVFIIHCV